MTDSRKPLARWYVVFAPLTVPLHLAWLVVTSIVAGAYYITVDLTLAPWLKRPLVIGGAAFWLFAPVVIIGMVPALAAHTLVWLARQCGKLFVLVGNWQVGRQQPAGMRMVLGAVWVTLFAAITAFCIDPQGSLHLIGSEIRGAPEYERAIEKKLTVGDVSQRHPWFAQRMESFRASFNDGGVNQFFSGSGVRMLSDVTRPVAYFPPTHLARVFGTPWYYIPADERTGQPPRCEFLAGPLLLAFVLLVRWPGLHAIRHKAWPPALYVLRVGGATVAVVMAATWSPWNIAIETTELHPMPQIGNERAESDVAFDKAIPVRDDAPYFMLPINDAPADSAYGIYYRVTRPATWLGFEPKYFLPPQWITLNLFLGLVAIGLVTAIYRVALAMRGNLGQPGYYTVYLALRLMQRKRIAFFSVSAVTLCVAMELIVISVMGGFLDTVRNRAYALVGDLVMIAPLTGFPRYQEFIREAQAMPEVELATPVIDTYGVLRFPTTGEVKAVEVRGIHLDEYRRVCGFGAPGVLFYDTYFPGTTSFDERAQPLCGYDPQTETVLLPDEYEAAWKRYLQSLTPEKRAAEEDRWERIPGYRYPGPGVMEPNVEAPEPSFAGRKMPGLIMGADVVFRRMSSGEYDRDIGYPVGLPCQISLLPLTRRGQISGEPPPAPSFRYVDDARTGVYENDKSTVYVSFEYLQDLLSMSPQKKADGTGETPPRCTQVMIRLKKGTPLNQTREKLRAKWDEIRGSYYDDDIDDVNAMRRTSIRTWEEMQRDFIAAIQKEKVLVVIMFGVISLVAVVLVLCIFYMIVVEKTRDIGIIKSVGGSAQGVAAVFLTYGAVIGVVGAILGSLIGIVFVGHINEFQDWLARLNPAWRIWSPETYSFDRIPDTVKMSEMIWIAVLAVVASIVGAVMPAIRAARVWPVEALRYE